jgi:hypothetical protein
MVLKWVQNFGLVRNLLGDFCEVTRISPSESKSVHTIVNRLCQTRLIQSDDGRYT